MHPSQGFASKPQWYMFKSLHLTIISLTTSLLEDQEGKK